MPKQPSSSADDKPSAISHQPLAEGPPQPSAIRHQPSKTVRQRTVLAIASAGGHWIQLRRFHPAFAGTRLIYATTRETYRAEVEEDGTEFRVVPDCNRWQKVKLIKAAIKIFLLLIKEKPDVIVSTGAAPGYFAIRLGKLLRKKTIWIDSIANAEELSLSGQKAGHHVDHWLTQWKHLARPNGPHFFGNVLGDDTKEDITNDSSLIANQNQQSVISNQQSEQSSAQPLAISHKSSDEVSSVSNTPTISSAGASAKEDQHSDEVSSSAISHQPSAISNRDKPLKIFVTVGTDLPFDRLVTTIDNWAVNQPQYEIFAQIGETEYKPKNLEYNQFIEPPDFKKRFREADFIISHAGMGTILSSLNYQKPLLILPRIAAKGEHRNEHQLATAKHLLELNKVNVAHDEVELLALLDNLQELPTKGHIGTNANSTLINQIRRLISNS